VPGTQNITFIAAYARKSVVAVSRHAVIWSNRAIGHSQRCMERPLWPRPRLTLAGLGLDGRARTASTFRFGRAAETGSPTSRLPSTRGLACLRAKDGRPRRLNDRAFHYFDRGWKAGIPVEDSCRRWAWESYHSQMNQTGVSSVRRRLPRTWVCGLSAARRTCSMNEEHSPPSIARRPDRATDGSAA
jgi:hypothetical protein